MIENFFYESGSSDLTILTGPDRAKTINNLCTNDLLKAASGDCLEAFVTNPQGKVLGFVEAMVFDDSIVILSNKGGQRDCLPHFQKYAIFDQTEISFAADQFFSLMIQGPSAISALAEMMGEQIEMKSGTCRKLQSDAGELFIKPGFLAGSIEIITNSDMIAEIRNALSLHGISALSSEAFHALRIRSGWPLSGVDTATDNLPQEIDRDHSAISFRKGCYLGQETVARLDALGHVNRKLMGVLLKPIENSDFKNNSLPIALHNESGQPVGEIRSLACESHTGLCVGLAMVRLKALESKIVAVGFERCEIQFQSLEEFRKG